MSGSGGTNVWFYGPVLGWMYTSDEAPSYYWSVEAESWLYHLEGSSTSADGRWFYNYGRSNWMHEDEFDAASEGAGTEEAPDNV